MKRIAVVLFGGLLTMVSGCTDSAPAPSDSGSTPDSTTSAAPAAETATENAAPAETPKEAAAEAKPEEAKPEEAKPEEAKPEGDKPAETTLIDPILKGLDLPGLDKAFTSRRDAYEKDPTNADAVQSFMGIVAQVGMIQAENGQKELAQQAYAKAAEMLDKALAANVTVDPGLQQFVFYNHACIKSLAGKPDEGLAMLEKAIEIGFSDMQQLNNDADLTAVRALPAFSEKLTAWEAKIKEIALAQAQKDLAEGETFPFTFELTDTNGAPIKLSDFQGKVCIVDIWGTWCPPCRAEIPSFVALQEKFGAQGFQIVGLNQESGDDDAAKNTLINSFIAENKMNYPCALINDDVMSQVPDFQGFPTTLFIDRSGKVRMKAVGLHEYSYLESIVEALLKEEASAAPSGEAAPAAGEAAPAAGEPAPAAGEAAPAGDAPKPVE